MQGNLQVDFRLNNNIKCKQIKSRVVSIRQINTKHPRRVPTLWASASGAGGGSGMGGGKSLGGSGDGDGADENEENKDNVGASGWKWQGWSDRTAADPQFAFKVFTEQILGVGAAVAGDMAGRPNWGMNELDLVFATLLVIGVAATVAGDMSTRKNYGLNELDLVFATLVVGSIMNFSIMYFLAPTASTVGVPYSSLSIIQRFFSEQTLLNMGAPGGHFFQPGFSLGGRFLNLGYKAVVFGAIGMFAGVFGTTMSNGLISLRQKMDPEFKPDNPVPSVLYNASAWSLHMGISSNIRYQLLNGLDMILVKAMPEGLFKLLTFFYRTGNNVLGGISFVTIAKLIGAQKTAAPVEIDDGKKKKKGKKSK